MIEMLSAHLMNIKNIRNGHAKMNRKLVAITATAVILLLLSAATAVLLLLLPAATAILLTRVPACLLDLSSSMRLPQR